jgi:hypothetical protein
MVNKSVSKLIAEMQVIFNSYIRERDKGLPCISCGAPHPTDAGHMFKKSTRPAMRFDPRACHSQCRECNSMHDGNYDNFCKGIAARHGVEFLTEVIQDSNFSRQTDHKWSRGELTEMILFYKKLIKDLNN